MKIAFVANNQKAAFFARIGKQISQLNSDIDVFYICFRNEEAKMYRGYTKDDKHILLLSYFSVKQSLPIGEYKLNELISRDRYMKYDYGKNLAFLTNMQPLFAKFLTDNGISYVFGEMTHAPEILMSRICKDKFPGKCYYLHPQSIRIPNGRFTFMNSEFQDDIFDAAKLFHPEDVLTEYDIPLKPIVPQRVADVAADVKNKMKLSKSFIKVFKALTINNFTRHEEKEYFRTIPRKCARRNAFRYEQNKLYYKYWLKTADWEEIEGIKYVFVTLHMQPEASVDVVARYYDNQLQNIINLWNILPPDTYIVVKEHTNAIANRGYDFFHKLKSLNNVIIANENISSHLLLNHSIAVFTGSGTVALEAALYKKHSLLYSHIFFDMIKYCHVITLEDIKYCKSLSGLLEECIQRDSEKMDIEEYSKYIIRSSFKGIVDPHNNSPLFTDENNINQIANSFVLFLNEKK